MNLGPLTQEEYAKWLADWRNWPTGTLVYLPRPPRAGLALTVFAAINRVKQRARRRLRRRFAR